MESPKPALTNCLETCPNCKTLTTRVQTDDPKVIRFVCGQCDFVFEEDEREPDSILIPLLKTGPLRVSRETLTRESRPGVSPYPCPRCRCVINITCSYQGRREEYTCGHCHYGWSLPATPEQSV